MLKTQPGDI